MSSHRATSWLLVMGVPVLVVIVLGWLLMGFGGDRTGVTRLPGVDGSSVEYLIDKRGRSTLEAVERLSPNEWRYWSGNGFLRCSRGDVLWIRVTLRNPGDRALHGVLENDDYFADRVDAWIAEEGIGQGKEHLLSGEGIQAREKALAGREVAWPVMVPAWGERVIHLRFDNFFGVYARPVWWPEAAAFHLARTRGGLAEGIYLGGLLALLGYNTLLWLRLRQADIGYYVLYLGSGAAFMAVARAQLPGLGWALGSPGLEIVLTIVMALNALFLTQFARVFLELRTHFPMGDRWVRGWRIVLLALASGLLLAPWWRSPGLHGLPVAALATGITHLGLLALALGAWRAGVWQARFFVLSFGCLFAGSLPMVAVWFFETQFRDAAMRGLMIGSALEMLMLSIAVADRFARAQRRLVEETEHRRMLEEAYADELAEEVRERTRELQAANTDKDRMLAVIGHDLRSPLTGLMRAAEGATGEFAHNVSQTGRTLLLMIEDLVLWARLRAGTQAVAVYHANALVAPAVALHRTLAEHSGVELVLDVREEMLVETDLVLAQTLVRNLLANALKFARTRVALRAEGVGGCVSFMVGNDGPPLQPAVAARLAAGEDEPMTATGGMGLRLCREICCVLGTRLDARSGVDGGTEFGFILKQATGKRADMNTVEENA